jgi:uncharacterized membrane protein YuzA (DUF378 family)
MLGAYWSPWAGVILLIVGLAGAWPLRGKQWKEIRMEQQERKSSTDANKGTRVE